MGFPSFLDGWLSKNNPRDVDKGAMADYQEKRRHNRITLDKKESVFMNLLNPLPGQSAEVLKACVVNVSMRGCRLSFQEISDIKKLNAGHVLVASLAVEDFPIPLNVEVLRVIEEKEVAIKFKPPYPRELERLEKFLEPRCLGMSLREINPKFLQSDQKKGLRWYQGVNETHLFVWRDPSTNGIVQLQMVFLAKVAEWGKDQGLRTGTIKPESQSADFNYGWVKSDLLEMHAKPNKEILNGARIILEASSIEPQVRETFLSKLKEA